MKTIIEGTRYDTEKAREIGRATSATPYVTDFHYWEAGLYVTPRSGRYFLAGEGGPMTTFCRRGPGPNERRGGSRIIPLSAEDALRWAEQNLTAEEVDAAFGDMIEDA